MDCPKCGATGFSVRGLGPHVAKCTGDPARTARLQRRRDRYVVSRSRVEAVTRTRGERQQEECGMDLTKLTWEQVVTLGRNVRDELAFRCEQARREVRWDGSHS